MKKKNIIMSILAAVLVIFNVCMFVFAYPYDKFPDTFSEAKDGVVFIASEYGTGSGFAIGENGKPVQYIVTNYHVVSDIYTGEKSDTVIVYFSAAANRYMTAQIYRYDSTKDIAVLRLPEPTNEVVPLKIRKSSETDKNGTFYALGFPARANDNEDYNKFDKTDIVTTSGMISKQSMIDERDVYLIDIEITHGNSGGPLVNENGDVVGINTFSITNEDDEVSKYAVCIDELTRIININEVPYTTTKDVNVGGIIVITVDIVVSIAIVCACVILFRKNSEVEIKVSKKSKNVSLKKNEDDNVGKTVAASDFSKTVAVGGSLGLITGIDGEFKERDFVIDKDLFFGRDPKRCNIIFPLDAEGVSGYHCKVYRENDKIMIMDLGSTYGTFINNGLKIGSNTAVELANGDTFYLGSDKNKFKVTR